MHKALLDVVQLRLASFIYLRMRYFLFMQMLPRKIPVIRVMPNTPVLIRSGASVFSCGTATRAGDAALTKRLFTAVGLCEVQLAINFLFLNWSFKVNLKKNEQSILGSMGELFLCIIFSKAALKIITLVGSPRSSY